MTSGADPSSHTRLFRWVRATVLGWLLGFVLVLVLALAWDMIGGGAQFMVGVGMGSNRPVAHNTNPDGSDFPAGRAQNRRVEFQIQQIGVVEGESPVF